MKIVGVAVVLALSLCSAVASAAEDSWDGGYSIQATRRSGFMAAIDLGFGMGHLAGYPNENSKIDDRAYRSSTGSAFGSTYTLWAGGALRDWFVFGLGLSAMGASKGKIQAGGSAFIVHVEAFPLWSLGGRFRDWSFYGNFGAGGVRITGGVEDADGGLMSTLAAGSSFELFRPGSFTFGPFLESTYMYSQSVNAFGVFSGVRASFHGGP
jgi:hypothetical protein